MVAAKDERLPIEKLLDDPAANAEPVVSWCVRTTGATLSEAARPLAFERAREVTGPATLLDLAAKWDGVAGLESLAKEARLVGAPLVEHLIKQRHVTLPGS